MPVEIFMDSQNLGRAPRQKQWQFYCETQGNWARRGRRPIFHVVIYRSETFLEGAASSWGMEKNVVRVILRFSGT